MSEAKFTPGPWDKYELIIGRMVDNRHRYTPIASIYESEPGYEGEDQANTHLIAAAPELYAMLAQTAEYFSDADGLEEDEYIYRQNVRAALAKARGEV